MVRPVATHTSFLQALSNGFDTSSDFEADKLRNDVERKLGIIASVERISKGNLHLSENHSSLRNKFLRFKIPRSWRRLFVVRWMAQFAHGSQKIVELILPIGVTNSRMDFDYNTGLNPYLELAISICRDFDTAEAKEFEIWMYDAISGAFKRKQFPTDKWPFVKKARTRA